MNAEKYGQQLAHEVLATIAQEASFSFARSSGAGGQNVNKVESKALIRWNLNESSLPQELKLKILAGLASYITVSGELLMTSEKYRDQAKNKSDVLDKLLTLLTKAFTPRKVRKPTRVGKKTKARRREAKKIHSDKKSSRQKVRY